MTTTPSHPTVKQDDLQTWASEVARHFPHLSQPQAWGLALWSFGMVMAQACGLTTVTYWLALFLSCKPATMRQQLREWYEEAAAKKSCGATQGVNRREVDVTTGAFRFSW